MYSKKEIGRAGDLLRNEELSDDQLEDAMTKLSYWRSQHDVPLKEARGFLQGILDQLNLKSSLISSRLKTEHSTSLKLRRYPKMSLKGMGDIAGCRVIVPNIKAIRKVARKLKSKARKSGLDLRLLHDYVESPKDDGYRSVHYQIKSKGYRVEVQLRTGLQHGWATSVEVIDTMKFNGTGLKHGREGRGLREWREFFISLSKYCQYIEEHYPHLLLPKKVGVDKQAHEIIKRLSVECGKNRQFSRTVNDLKKKMRASRALNILDKCTCSADAATKRDKIADGYFLVRVNASVDKFNVSVDHFSNVAEADPAYQEMEIECRANENDACYLVAVKNIGALHSTYPNFFADTRYILSNILWIQ